MEGSREDAFHFGNGRRHAVQLVGGHVGSLCWSSEMPLPGAPQMAFDVNPNLRIVCRAERAMPAAGGWVDEWMDDDADDDTMKDRRGSL